LHDLEEADLKESTAESLFSGGAVRFEDSADSLRFEGGEEAGGDAQGARSQKAKAKAMSARAHDRPTGGRRRGID
jgi:hypothetical protein